MSEIRAMEEIKVLFNRFTNLVEKDIKGVHIGCYSIALLGLTVAIRKVRPFSKFKRPKDIPNHFITEKRELTGLVKRIDPNGGLLMVEHKPLVDLPIVSSGQLPVKISGINVSGLGLNWLQAIVAGQKIKFVPIEKNNDFVQCQVMLVQNTNKEKPDFLNVGERLVKIGFAQTVSIEHPLLEDSQVMTYYKGLQAAENYALRKKIGLKYYIKPTKNAFQVLFKNINTLSKVLTKSAKKQIKTLPQLAST
ncbi:protein C3orf33 [Rhynchophorus ferrugineus]|uniref:Uncharacterized protein n=1 Tax=Rhynchophorus ferrugineus TaxID=354439 RepID=A0A834I8F4_RHYFE|nr:hypothetical protein GWI33_012859 [Rhynchophorus ferrugineus]